MHLRHLSSALGRFLALALVGCAVPSGAAATEPACEFRLATVETLFEAANEAAVAGAELAAGDGRAAAARLRETADRLLTEKRRIAGEGRAQLETTERKALIQLLRAARKRASKAARRSGRNAASAIAPADGASAAIETALGAQADAYATHGCVGSDLRVSALFIGAGETRSVPGGAAIVAELGIDILGELVARGPGGGLALAAASGDVVLEGKIDARGTGAAPGAANALHARSGFDDVPACGEGQPLSITAETGNVRIGATFFALSGDGYDCPPLRVTAASQLHQDAAFREAFRGRNGGSGGALVVAAPAGAIRFAARRADDPGPFSPGNGGAGESLTLTESFVPPAGFPQLHVSGGGGGHSGELALRAAQLDLGALRRVYGPSEGGDGGSFAWNARAGNALFPLGLRSLVLQGGWGGIGSTRGGRGGDLRYDGDRVVNLHEQPVTLVTGKGGFGGEVFHHVPRGPDDRVESNDGGEADVTGHRGWDGTAAHPDGATGGEVRAEGGSASLGALFEHANGIGGRGGDARAKGGRGGNGRPSCADPAGSGGNGGEGGSVRAQGGHGGAAPGGTGGDGGSVLFAETGSPGFGGDGQPAGGCGALANGADVAPGDGGEGFILGAQGEAVAAVTSGCEGEEVVTCDDGPPQPEPDGCARPRFFTSHVVDYTATSSGTSLTRTHQLDGSEPCSIGGCLARHKGSLTETQVSAAGPRTKTIFFDVEVQDLFPPGPHLHFNFIDHCTRDGELHVGGGSGVDDLGDSATGAVHTVTHRCSGLCGCGSHWRGCCPCPECQNGWKLDGDGVCD